jgi:hypothetical protein
MGRKTAEAAARNNRNSTYLQFFRRRGRGSDKGRCRDIRTLLLARSNLLIIQAQTI